ncbi:MAG: DUF362 domain-containing protein [Planctomycetes bacterium]|nr:DUF362 domain-containing protein [Planctomycetota bacterium]
MRRRDFIKAAGISLAGLYLLRRHLLTPVYAAGKSLVAVVRNPAMRNQDGEINKVEVQRTIYEALRILAGSGAGEEALKSVIPEPQKNVVGLKVNTYFGESNNATRPALAYGLAEFLLKIGVKENNIIIWDNAADEMEQAGYKINDTKKGIRVLATVSSRIARKSKPLAGFEDNPITVGKSADSPPDVHRGGKTQTRLSKIINMCSVIINLPVLKTYKFKDNSGIENGLLNMYRAFEITDGNAGAFYDNECNPGAAEFYSLPQVKGKVKLTVCDAIYPLYNGGPGEDSRYHWNCNGIIAGLDPVAIDVIGQEIIQKHRDKTLPNEPTLKTTYLETCAGQPYKLGVNARDEIELVEKTI